MDHNGLFNGPSPYADTAEARPLGIEFQGGNHFIHAQNVSRSGLDQLAAQLDMMSFAEQNKQQLAAHWQQQQQQQQHHLIQQHEHVLAQQQMNEYQQQLRRTDPVYASMTSHNVSNSNPSPPPADQRQTPPPDTSFELAMAEEFSHMQSTGTLLKRPELMPSRCQMHLI